jgi:hypothetical protein
MSTVLPAAAGTITLTGFVGQLSAFAPMLSRTIVTTGRIALVGLMVPSMPERGLATDLVVEVPHSSNAIILYAIMPVEHRTMT